MVVDVRHFSLGASLEMCHVSQASKELVALGEQSNTLFELSNQADPDPP